MTSGTPITNATRSRILHLLAGGLGYRQIARRLEIHRTTVAAVVRDAAVAWWRERVAEQRAEDLAGRGE